MTHGHGQWPWPMAIGHGHWPLGELVWCCVGPKSGPFGQNLRPWDVHFRQCLAIWQCLFCIRCWKIRRPFRDKRGGTLVAWQKISQELGFACKIGLEGRSGMSAWKVSLQDRLGRSARNVCMEGRPGKFVASKFHYKRKLLLLKNQLFSTRMQV